MSVILVGCLIPIGIALFEMYPNSIEELQQIGGGRITTNILYELPHILQVNGGWAVFLFFVAQPATPLIAALLTTALIGRQSIQALVSRWRFWSKEVGWKKGVLIWVLAIVSFALVVD